LDGPDETESPSSSQLAAHSQTRLAEHFMAVRGDDIRDCLIDGDFEALRSAFGRFAQERLDQSPPGAYPTKFSPMIGEDD
jgi:hypothetical protein